MINEVVLMQPVDAGDVLFSSEGQRARWMGDDEDEGGGQRMTISLRRRWLV